MEFFFQIKASRGSCDEIFLSQLDIRRIVVINNSACRFYEQPSSNVKVTLQVRKFRYVEVK